jgi:hypothetical protein
LKIGSGRRRLWRAKLLQGLRYLPVRTILQGIAEVLAVDLAVPEKGAEARVQEAGG